MGHECCFAEKWVIHADIDLKIFMYVQRAQTTSQADNLQEAFDMIFGSRKIPCELRSRRQEDDCHDGRVAYRFTLLILLEDVQPSLQRLQGLGEVEIRLVASLITSKTSVYKGAD